KAEASCARGEWREQHGGGGAWKQAEEGLCAKRAGITRSLGWLALGVTLATGRREPERRPPGASVWTAPAIGRTGTASSPRSVPMANSSSSGPLPAPSSPAQRTTRRISSSGRFRRGSLADRGAERRRL